MRPRPVAYRREARNFIPQPLALYHGNLIAHPLIGVEIEREPRVEALDDVSARPLHRPRTNATAIGLENRIRSTSAEGTPSDVSAFIFHTLLQICPV